MSVCDWPDSDGVAQLPTLESSSGTLNYNNNNPNPPMMPSNNNRSVSFSPLINSSLEEDNYSLALPINNLNLCPPPLMASLSTNSTLDSTTNNGPLQVINPTTSSAFHQPPHHDMFRSPQGGGGEEEQRQGYMFLVKSEVDVLYDGYFWHKYGQKKIKNRVHPRSYYKCAHGGCKILKQVERSSDDPTIVCITYYGQHTHEATT